MKLLILILFLLSCHTSFDPNTNDCVNNVADCAGVCGGTAIEDACGVCEGDDTSCTDCAGVVNGDTTEDCAGECGGSAVEDECGVCSGDGSTCEGGWNVYYDTSIPIGGFQFDIMGVTILSASGGAAEAAGITVSTSQVRVLGFSFSGNVIPAGNNNILTILQLAGDMSNACISNPIIPNTNGDSIEVEVIGCQQIREK